MRYIFFKIIGYSLFSILFVSCKKYPEDILWFRNPEKQPVLIGYLTKYQVNGIDSLDLLNYYLQAVPHFSNMNIRECRFDQVINHGKISGEWTLGPLCSPSTFQEFKDKGKKIRISYALDGCIGRNIFLNQDWTILNFPTKRKPGLKLKCIVNGNTYEIQITN
jgi:hypothetical protein